MSRCDAMRGRRGSRCPSRQSRRASPGRAGVRVGRDCTPSRAHLIGGGAGYASMSNCTLACGRPRLRSTSCRSTPDKDGTTSPKTDTIACGFSSASIQRVMACLCAEAVVIYRIARRFTMAQGGTHALRQLPSSATLPPRFAPVDGRGACRSLLGLREFTDRKRAVSSCSSADISRLKRSMTRIS